MKKEKHILYLGVIFIFLFLTWTCLIQTADVHPIGETGTNVGFAGFNSFFHKFFGVHMTLYYITDWLGLVPLFVCMVFGAAGFFQFIARKTLLKVDFDIILLGIYYVAVIFFYLFFEEYPINYRPVLINGYAEASYPSSTVLLVLSVMPTLVFQTEKRLENKKLKTSIKFISFVFSCFMVIGRLFSGVHWFTDIIGSVLLSTGLFLVYKSAVLMYYKNKD